MGRVCGDSRRAKAYKERARAIQDHGKTIKRVFADAKEKRGVLYTISRFEEVEHYLTLLFTCMI